MDNDVDDGNDGDEDEDNDIVGDAALLEAE